MRKPDELSERAAEIVNGWVKATGDRRDYTLLAAKIEQHLLEVRAAAFHKGVIFGQRPRNRISKAWQSWRMKRRLRRFAS